MCDGCSWRANHPSVYASRGYTICRDFEMPVTAEPPAQPATPPPKSPSG